MTPRRLFALLTAAVLLTACASVPSRMADVSASAPAEPATPSCYRAALLPGNAAPAPTDDTFGCKLLRLLGIVGSM